MENSHDIKAFVKIRHREHLWLPPKQTKCSGNTAPGQTQGGHFYVAGDGGRKCVNCNERNVYVCERCSHEVPPYNLLRGPIAGMPSCESNANISA